MGLTNSATLVQIPNNLQFAMQLGTTRRGRGRSIGERQAFLKQHGPWMTTSPSTVPGIQQLKNSTACLGIYAVKFPSACQPKSVLCAAVPVNLTLSKESYFY